jgi:hypothetical protein
LSYDNKTYTGQHEVYIYIPTHTLSLPTHNPSHAPLPQLTSPKTHPIHVLTT